MESEDVTEKTEWQVRMVVAGFEVKEWKKEESETVWVFKGHTWRLIPVLWTIDKGSGHWAKMSVGSGPDEAWFEIDQATATADFRLGNPQCNELLMQGLYRLGVDSNDLLREFSVGLFSAHQIMELRLSLPREFWPQKWIDEEAQ